MMRLRPAPPPSFDIFLIHITPPPLLINAINIIIVGPMQRAQRNHFHRRRILRPRDHILRSEYRHDLRRCRFFISGDPISQGHRTQITRERGHAMANILGGLFSILDHRSIHHESIVLDPILLFVQIGIFALGHAPPNARREVPV